MAGHLVQIPIEIIPPDLGVCICVIVMDITFSMDSKPVSAWQGA